MPLYDNAPITISSAHTHNHIPTPRYSIGIRQFMNRLRERGMMENIAPHLIVDQEAHLNPEIAMEIGRPAAIRSIHRARRRVNPSIPQLLSDWPDIINSDEFGPQLLYVNGTRDFFFQGSLEILRDDGSIRFVGLVFTNVAFLQQMNAHIQTVRTLCMDGTFQVRPRQPPDIEQLFTVQIILNNVAIPIVHILMVDRLTESYCRVLQFLREDLDLNLDYQQLQIITDFEQALRNAINRVMPEVNNSGCWFHFIQSIVRFIRSHQLTQLSTTNEDARRILRMLMSLAHLPADEIRYHGVAFSIQLGFHVIQDTVTEYHLDVELHELMQYFQRYWMDTVTPQRFSVYGLQHRTNNYIESYHSSLLRLMGQHPSLYQFYDHLRTIEERSRNDLRRAVNGQQVRQLSYSVNNRSTTTIRNAWRSVENGNYDLRAFLRNVSYIPEQIIRNQIGEQNFGLMPEINNLAIPPRARVLRPLLLGPLRPPPLAVVPAVQPPLLRIQQPAVHQPPPIEQAPIQLAVHQPPPIEQAPIQPAEVVRRRNRQRRGQPYLRGHHEPQNHGRQMVRVNMEEAWAEFLVDRDARSISPDQEMLELCTICMDRVVTVTIRPCNHTFCRTCIRRMRQELYNVCPLCRGQINNYENY
ncbi:uncharacterized protein LOC126549205 isoform X2 [Aphis gossypii]|uniref:uncharacterized protein LOC126549205 isoform X2 n=1 Tax=Aphis gossypii TaxID=80765 RepID=UPI00215976EA|nr:uncharacterized protein LOC126549205 isoform X2 [Aphis gossypii]